MAISKKVVDLAMALISGLAMTALSYYEIGESRKAARIYAENELLEEVPEAVENESEEEENN